MAKRGGKRRDPAREKLWRRTIRDQERSGLAVRHAADFSTYHQVFNRAAWSPLRLAGRLLPALVEAFAPPGWHLHFAIDETLERRWGSRIRLRGHYRDPLA